MRAEVVPCSERLMLGLISDESVAASNACTTALGFHDICQSDLQFEKRLTYLGVNVLKATHDHTTKGIILLSRFIKSLRAANGVI